MLHAKHCFSTMHALRSQYLYMTEDDTEERGTRREARSNVLKEIDPVTVGTGV